VSSAAVAIPQDELVLGRYRPVQPLGSGGSGTVWLARDELDGGEVTLKIVAREGKAAARAEREAEAAARLDHERCLKARDFGTDAEHSYIAYEYVPGETFRHALRAGRLNDGTTVEAGAQILEGLAHAHELGIVHRDVKPSNVLLADHEEAVSVRLLDFGLALFDEADTLTAAGDVPGTLAYISPERLKGQTAGPEADVWAVGVLLWEALAGFHPYWTSSMLETAKRIQEQPPSLGTARPDLPAPLIEVVDRAMCRDARKRPTATRMAGALRSAWRSRERRRRPPRRTRQTTRTIPTGRIAAVSLAALVAGWTASTIPFFPEGSAWILAAVATVLTVLRERAGLAFVLAVPVLPLGNVSTGLALA
jgi:eukaryotic-like serine/threonine-protein kinase